MLVVPVKVFATVAEKLAVPPETLMAELPMIWPEKFAVPPETLIVDVPLMLAEMVAVPAVTERFDDEKELVV
jgi:hypothetical protein